MKFQGGEKGKERKNVFKSRALSLTLTREDE